MKTFQQSIKELSEAWDNLIYEILKETGIQKLFDYINKKLNERGKKK